MTLVGELKDFAVCADIEIVLVSARGNKNNQTTGVVIEVRVFICCDSKASLRLSAEVPDLPKILYGFLFLPFPPPWPCDEAPLAA